MLHTYTCMHAPHWFNKREKMGDKNYVYNDSLGFTQALLHSYSTYHIITSQQHCKELLTSRRFFIQYSTKKLKKWEWEQCNMIIIVWQSMWKNIIVVWWYGVAYSYCIHSFPFNLTRRSRHTINAILVLLFMKISESIMIRNL